MTLPSQGDVWAYSYLWHWQHEHGETEGRKTRPTSLVAAARDTDGRTNLFILAITSRQPGKNRAALPIPQIERARAGLDPSMPLWVMLDEYNHDILETSFYIEPDGRMGAFSAAFHTKVFAEFLTQARAGRVHKVPRTEQVFRDKAPD